MKKPEFSHLAKLVMRDHEFEQLTEQLDYYCPFEAMGVARHEIRHSNFLADLLSPERTHGMGDTVLRSFLDTLLGSEGDDQNRLRLHLADLSKTEVLREWQNIDLICRIGGTDPEILICVEIKVEAAETKGQLKKYQKTIKQEWPESEHKFFFLTPTGIEASEKKWTAVSFSELMAGFDKVVANGHGTPNANRMMSAYIAMMRRKYVPNEDLEELARQIWNKHAQTLEFLIDQKPDIMRDSSLAIRQDRFPEIVRAVHDKTGMTIGLDQCNNTYIRIAVPSWDNTPGMLCSSWTDSKRVLLCELEMYRDRVHIRMQLGPGHEESRNKIFGAIQASGFADPGRKKTISRQWSRLAAKTLLGNKEVEEFRTSNNRAGLVNKTEKKVIEFLCEHISGYTKALKTIA